MKELDWVNWLIIAFIVVAAIAAGVLFWGYQDAVTRAVAVTVLLVSLLAAVGLQLWRSQGTAVSAICDGYKACVAWLLALGGGALVVFVLVWVMVKFTGADGGNAVVALPLIVMVGVIVLLIVISLVTFTFSVLGLASPTEALGLPDGSVRAVIALMLLVLFSIVSIFLYNSVAAGGGTVRHIEHVPDEQLSAMRAQVSIVAAVPETPAGTSTVYYRNVNAAGDDIAKQLIVLLGTLVTAVSSFYFGSNAVASANAAAMGQQSKPVPQLTSISPNPLKPGGDAQTLTLTGSNLGKIADLHLEQKGAADIEATDVTVTDSTVTAKVKIPADSTGTWDVVVEDADKKPTVLARVEIKGNA